MSELDATEFTLAAVVSSLDRARAASAADAIEFRMDHATDPLTQLASYDHQLPLIATNRAAWEGGDAADTGRIAALETAAEHPAVGAVDIELDSVEEGEGEALRDIARTNDTAVIVSWHDFERTPPRDVLTSRLATAAEWGDIGKLSVTANTPEDVLDLLSVTLDQSQAGNSVATMSMGHAGRHSRVIAPLYGSRIGYAPIDASEATAPGQFELDRLAELVSTLRG